MTQTNGRINAAWLLILALAVAGVAAAAFFIGRAALSPDARTAVDSSASPQTAATPTVAATDRPVVRGRLYAVPVGRRLSLSVDVLDAEPGCRSWRVKRSLVYRTDCRSWEPRELILIHLSLQNRSDEDVRVQLHRLSIASRHGQTAQAINLRKRAKHPDAFLPGSRFIPPRRILSGWATFPAMDDNEGNHIVVAKVIYADDMQNLVFEFDPLPRRAR